METDDLLDVERALLSRLPYKVEEYMKPTPSSDVSITSLFSSGEVLGLLTTTAYTVVRLSCETKQQISP